MIFAALWLLLGCGEPAGEVVTAAPAAPAPEPEPRMTRPTATARVFQQPPQLPSGLSDPWLDVGACPVAGTSMAAQHRSVVRPAHCGSVMNGASASTTWLRA